MTMLDLGQITAQTQKETMIRMRAAVALTTTLFFVSGCSSEQTAQPNVTNDVSVEAADTSATEESTAKVIPAVSLSTTCNGMLLPDGGLVVEASLFLTNVEELDVASVDTASKLYTRLGVQAELADDSLAASIEGMQRPFQQFIQAAEANESWTLDAENYKRDANKVNDICAEYIGDEPVSTPDPKPTTAEAPSKATEIGAAYPGYPLIVNVASLDYRVANWYEGKLVDGQVVALAPGLYSPFNPNVPDLASYYESGSVDGDSAMKGAVLPNQGGATWSGVLPGAEEPQ